MIENRKIAVLPGSFDPFTKGHEDIVRRALPLFDALYIAIGHNISKKRTFDISSHIEGIQRLFANETKVKVISYEGLTIDFCHQVKAKYIIRGIRNSEDFLYESEMAAVNKTLAPDIETIFLYTDSKFAHVSSSVVRELRLHGGDYQQFLPFDLCEK